MRLPELLVPADVSQVLEVLGEPADRTAVGRALRQFPVAGLAPPTRRGQPWHIPRAKLVEVVGACLLRRAMRSHDRWSADGHESLLDAAELLLGDPELARLVPRSLKRAVLERQEARRRAEAEHRRRIGESLERQRRAEAAARRRAREEEARWFEELQRKREREEHERLMRAAYSICFRAAYRAIGSPKGPRWPELPEARQLRRDFPHERPAWWLPPPGLLDAVKAQDAEPALPGQQEPDWSRWVPPYVPGRPWPWREEDVGHLGHADCA